MENSCLIKSILLLFITVAIGHAHQDGMSQVYRGIAVVKSPTPKPTRRPSRKPTRRPSRNPTRKPSRKLTYEPSLSPTHKPSPSPTHKPSPSPTNFPTFRQTTKPTLVPRTSRPTLLPTKNASLNVDVVTLPLDPIRIDLTIASNETVNYDGAKSVLAKHLTSFFKSDQDLSSSFRYISLTHKLKLRRRRNLRTANRNGVRFLNNVIFVEYDGTATFNKQGAPSIDVLLAKQNTALTSEPWTSQLASDFSKNQLGTLAIRTNDSGGSAAGPVAGGIVAALIIVGGVIAVAILYMRRRRRVRREDMPKAKRSIPPPPPIPPQDESTFEGSKTTVDDAQRFGWRSGSVKVSITSTSPSQEAAPRISNMVTGSSNLDVYSLNGDEEIEDIGNAGDEMLRHVMAMGDYEPVEPGIEFIISSEDPKRTVQVNEDDVVSNDSEQFSDEGSQHHVASENNSNDVVMRHGPDLTLFQLSEQQTGTSEEQESFFAPAINLWQSIMSFDIEDQHRITVISSPAVPKAEFVPAQTTNRPVLAVVSEDSDSEINDSSPNQGNYERQNSHDVVVMSPLTDNLSPLSASTSISTVHPDALRERLNAAIATSASATTKERHDAMLQASYANLRSDEVSSTRMASDARKSRLTSNFPKLISMKSGDAAELRKIRLQQKNYTSSSGEQGAANTDPISATTKNLRKTRLAQENSSNRLSKSSW